LDFSKAWIGAAFSLGFIFGPLLGALCSQLGIIYWPNSSVSFFIFPASVSLVLSLINIGFINKFCPETLPISKRVCVFVLKFFFDFEVFNRMKRKQR
jgi:MFS family permease